MERFFSFSKCRKKHWVENLIGFSGGILSIVVSGAGNCTLSVARKEPARSETTSGGQQFRYLLAGIRLNL